MTNTPEHIEDTGSPVLYQVGIYAGTLPVANHDLAQQACARIGWTLIEEIDPDSGIWLATLTADDAEILECFGRLVRLSDFITLEASMP